MYFDNLNFLVCVHSLTVQYLDGLSGRLREELLCGGHVRTAACALVSAHSCIISCNQLDPLSFRSSAG